MRIFRGSDGTTAYTILGDDDDQTGPVSRVGDVNGDGYADIVVRSPIASNLPVPGGGSAAVHLGGPRAVQVFGAACAYAEAGHLGEPAVGSQDFAVSIWRTVAGGGFVFNGLGARIDSWVGIPLPLDLAFLGAPGCTLHIAPVLLSSQSSFNEVATQAYPIPSIASLAGKTVYTQWAILDFSATLLGLVATDALSITLTH